MRLTTSWLHLCLMQRPAHPLCLLGHFIKTNPVAYTCSIAQVCPDSVEGRRPCLRADQAARCTGHMPSAGLEASSTHPPRASRRQCQAHASRCPTEEGEAAGHRKGCSQGGLVLQPFWLVHKDRRDQSNVLSQGGNRSHGCKLYAAEGELTWDWGGGAEPGSFEITGKLVC